MSSTDMLSWLGDPDVSVMSEDGHRVMTHRAVLGLYSSSFRHLLSINTNETCMIILHDVDSMQLEEIIRSARKKFQRFFMGEYQMKEDDESQTELISLPDSETVTVKEEVETSPPTPSNDHLDSTSDSSCDSTCDSRSDLASDSTRAAVAAYCYPLRKYVKCGAPTHPTHCGTSD